MKFDVVKGNNSIVMRQSDGLFTIIYVNPLTQQVFEQKNLTYHQLSIHTYIDKNILAFIKK